MNVFTKTARQQEATKIMTSHLFTLLEGGSRSGKTFIYIRNLIVRALKRRSNHLVMRKYFSSVKRSVWYGTLPDVLEVSFPGFIEDVHYGLNKTDFFIKFRNKSKIWLGGFDDEKRLEKLLGNEYSTILLNEASEMVFNHFEISKTRLAESSGLDLRLWVDENPPSKKHWTFRLFHKGINPDDGTRLIESEKKKYGCLRINPEHNKSNLPGDYFGILDGLSKRKRARFRDGLYSSDVDGALWSNDMINSAQLQGEASDWLSEKAQTVVALDPNVAEDKKKDEDFKADEAGIVVISKDNRNRTIEGKALVEADYSGKLGVTGWAKKAVWAYYQHDADCIVAEVNQGGELVRQMIKAVDKRVVVKTVRATKGKHTRGEPIAELYENGQIKHAPKLDKLEDEMLEYVPGITTSPNRMDAQVWGNTYLFLGDHHEKIQSIRVR